MPVVYFLCTLGNFSRVLLFNILLFVYQKKKNVAMHMILCFLYCKKNLLGLKSPTSLGCIPILFSSTTTLFC